MGTRGCVSIDSLPLQVLLRENPGWAGGPVAVTKEERPQSPILALNREARQRGLAVGTRYASALSLVPDLRARAVPPESIAEARDRIVRSVLAFTPDIELCPFDSDSLWVSVEGLGSLFRTEADWAARVRGALLEEGLRAVTVIGFTRFGTWAIARTRSRSLSFATREQEKATLERTPADILPLPSRTRSILSKLEIRTVRQFVSLPEGEVTRRFGREAGALHRALLSDDPLPIQPVSPVETVPCARLLDSPLADVDLIMRHVDELLAIETRRAEAERSVISELSLALRTEDGDATVDVIRPAVPTLSLAVLRRLVYLRVSARKLTSGVQDIEIRSTHARPSRTQEELFGAGGRDLQAGARVFAALRARFGNEAVTCAQPRDSWLPEQCFRWTPLKKPVVPRAPAGAEERASRLPSPVRRILFTPSRAERQPAEPRPAEERFLLSGAWWGTAPGEAPFRREYFFQTTTGCTRWLYRDACTGETLVQGEVD